MTDYYTIGCSNTTYASSSTASDNSTWYIWNDQTSSSTCWQTWSSGTTAGNTFVAQGDQPVVWVAPSTEELSAIEQDRQRFAHEMEEREQRRKESNARAEALLKSLLTDDQRRSLEQMKQFAIRSQTGKPYRIRLSGSMNVDELDEQGKVLHTYCLVPKENLPLHDNLAIQKLMLETAEADFLRIANRR